MVYDNTKQIVEALLMASDEPLSVERVLKILNSNNNFIEIKTLREIVNELIDDYSDRGIELKEVASGFRFQVKPGLSYWIGKLHEERPPKYSKALLETLALIAYRQPITRSEIEDVRGVSVGSNIVRTLLDHEWVKVIGHKEVPGRPALFATTKRFLDHFNLKHLNELPPLAEFTEEIAEGLLHEVLEEEQTSSSTPDASDSSSQRASPLKACGDMPSGDLNDFIVNTNEIKDEPEIAIATASIER